MLDVSIVGQRHYNFVRNTQDSDSCCSPSSLLKSSVVRQESSWIWQPLSLISKWCCLKIVTTLPKPLFCDFRPCPRPRSYQECQTPGSGHGASPQCELQASMAPWFFVAERSQGVRAGVRGTPLTTRREEAYEPAHVCLRT